MIVSLFYVRKRCFAFLGENKYNVSMSIWRYFASKNIDVHKIARRGVKHTVDLVRSIWQCLCSGFDDFQSRSLEAITLIEVSKLDPRIHGGDRGRKQGKGSGVMA